MRRLDDHVEKGNGKVEPLNERRSLDSRLLRLYPSASFFLSFVLGALDFRASSLQARREYICVVSSIKFVLICYSNDRKLTQFSINVSSRH